MRKATTSLLFLLSLLMGFQVGVVSAQDPFSSYLNNSLYSYFTELSPILSKNKPKSDSVKVNKQNKTISIFANKCIESVPFREDVVQTARDTVIKSLPKEYKNYQVKIFVNGYEIAELIPNIYREKLKQDKKRSDNSKKEEKSIVRGISRKCQPSQGLLNNTIALWASHGWYFNKKEDRWTWQRPRLFQVTEDTYTMGYVLPYLTPMLENAGAYVMMPRERDTQTNEVIVDNDDRNFLYEESNNKNNRWRRGDSTGFARATGFYSDYDNPFCYGTYRQIKCDKKGECYARWTPEIPEEGEYAVYISYKTLPNSTDAAHYTVYHSGGRTEFLVNQKMGGGTWIYLGTFAFQKGLNPEIGQIELTNQGDNHTVVSADAVRFGGGYSVVARRNAADSLVLGNKPKYLEGARYWLQWAGFPDSIYSRNNETDDYKDDYMCRGHWVNHLIGGSSKSPDTKGLNIPVQMAFGFHTDAGQLFNDSTIGTMAIYMSESEGSKVFDNEQKRIASRDLADIIQTQIVEDIRLTYRPTWSRRKLTDASYYEARVPKVPTMLLELLSHQNLTDMRYGLDPHFRFTVSRAIYKGIVKFLCHQQNRPYVIQPLPVKNFSAAFSNKFNNVVQLNWTQQADSLEPTASSDYYILYTSIDGKGWDNGQIVTNPHTQVTLQPNVIYQFKVTACNEGGESFPSEVLSVGNHPMSQGTALIINGFHRVAAPEWFDSPNHSGFLDKIDRGVADHYDLSYTGSQYVFNKFKRFSTNYTPGHGASHALFENNIIAGNTFDYTYLHGEAILKAGYSFVSCSDEVLQEAGFSLKPYTFIDMILGLEKTTQVGNQLRYQLFPVNIRKTLTQYLERFRGNLYISGAYVASDVYERDSCDWETIEFTEQVLRYKLSESRAQSTGIISNYFSIWDDFSQKYYHYNNSVDDKMYAVEYPDGLDTSFGSQIIHSFEKSNLPATIGYKGKYKTIISSVPFESIRKKEDRENLMKEITNFFKR